MKNFSDYTSNVSKQTFSAAAIVDSKGKQQGKIIIRFTDSQIGYNHQLSVVFYPSDELGYTNTSKGGTYSQPATLYKHFKDAGIDCFNFHGQKIGGYGDKGDFVNYDSMSRFDEIVSIKYKRKTYRILWVM